MGLNFADIFAIQGLYSATPKGSFIPGLEFSGKINNIGNDVEDWKVVDWVMAKAGLSVDKIYICS